MSLLESASRCCGYHHDTKIACAHNRWTIYRHPSTSIRNKALLRFIQGLTPARYHNQQQLVLQIIALAPEIMAPYVVRWIALQPNRNTIQ
jgi:hypothetical protein